MVDPCNVNVSVFLIPRRYIKVHGCYVKASLHTYVVVVVVYRRETRENSYHDDRNLRGFYRL